MWRVIGLMLVALFVGTNANVIIRECPVIFHEDEVHYIAPGKTSVDVTLSEWQIVSGDVTSQDCSPYDVGKTLEVGLGDCDIKCEACNGDVCCPYKYVLTVKEAVCPEFSHENEVYYLTSGQEYKRVKLTEWTATSGEASTVLKCGPYVAGRTLKVLPGVCDIKCEACVEGDLCCPYKYVLTVVERSCSVEIIENGKMTSESLLIGSTATVTCNDGFASVGKSGPITCKSTVNFGEVDGSSVELGKNSCYWENMPECKAITCNKPGKGTQTESVTGGKRTLNEAYTYICNPGYATSDQLKTVCEVDGTSPTGKWSVPPPICEDIDECKSGENECDSDAKCDNKEGDYDCTCNPGFVGNGKSCNAITCNKPGKGTQTESVTGGKRTVNEAYTYICNPGYTATSDQLKTVCEVDGTSPTGKWSVAPPICEAITCDRPREGTETVAFLGESWKHNEEFTYACKPDYTLLSGELKTVCTVDVGASTGHWSNEPPICEAPQKSSTEGAPLKCPRGFELFEGKYCFNKINEDDIWEVQAQKCKAKKGQLAIPRSQDKAEVLRKYHSKKNPAAKDVWIGPQALVDSNVFTDFDLNRLSFINFKNGKPAKASGKGLGPDCVSVSAQNGKWTNECCYNRHPAICETGPLGVPECDDVSGYVFFEGRCLRFITNPDSFEAQCNECRRLNGRLAPSLNEAQNAALLAFYEFESPANGNPAWFNLHNLISSSNYQTTELLTSTFSKLHRRSSDSARCVNIGSHGWEKECCHEKLPAICELNRCPQHYIEMGDTCVRLLQTPDTWEASEKKCRKDGASLLVFRAASTRSQFLELIGKDSTFVSEGSWIGCHDQVEEEKIQTPSLQDVGFSSQVSGNNAERDCCLLGSSAITMECCYEKQRAVCSLPLTK